MTVPSRSASSAGRRRRQTILTRPVPDWALVQRELPRKSVTLQLLWAEYRARCPDGFGYTWFTERYRAYAGRLDIVLRGDHRADEKLFVDFAHTNGSHCRMRARARARGRTGPRAASLPPP